MKFFLKKLLNPHGSDETYDDCSIKYPTEDFLTHTVQMKRALATRKSSGAAYFLTHTVQMKPDIPFVLFFKTLNFLTHTVQMKPEITTPNII